MLLIKTLYMANIKKRQQYDTRQSKSISYSNERRISNWNSSLSKKTYYGESHKEDALGYMGSEIETVCFHHPVNDHRKKIASYW